jgi:hypothetical protein
MKIFGLCAGCGVLGFLVMGYQAGLFNDAGSQKEGKAEPSGPPPAPFPHALMHACQGEPVPEAAEYKKGKRPHPLVYFHVNGKNEWAVYEDWQEKVREEWQAGTVEKAELVVVISKHQEIHIETRDYSHIKAPPISRYRYELDVYVRSARTGDVLCHKRFINNPREIMRVEEWRLTKLGKPVEYKTVSDWLKAQAQKGFTQDDRPIVTVPQDQ